jgi:hypothetical protein
MTLDGLYNKSQERFVLSKCPENAPMDQNGQFKLYRDTTLVKEEYSFYTSFDVGP